MAIEHLKCWPVGAEIYTVIVKNTLDFEDFILKKECKIAH